MKERRANDKLPRPVAVQAVYDTVSLHAMQSGMFGDLQVGPAHIYSGPHQAAVDACTISERELLVGTLAFAMSLCIDKEALRFFEREASSLGLVELSPIDHKVSRIRRLPQGRRR